jgi:hypothetical protein
VPNVKKIWGLDCLEPNSYFEFVGILLFKFGAVSNIAVADTGALAYSGSNIAVADTVDTGACRVY